MLAAINHPAQSIAWRTLMIARSLVLVFASLAQSVAVATDVLSQVESVTVYPSGATVTRIADVALSAGLNEVRLVGLANSIDVDRLQVEVVADNVRIGGINVHTEQEREAYDVEIAAVRTQIEALTARINAADDSSNAAKLRLKFLDGIAQGYAKEAWFEGSRGSANTSSWLAALELLQNGSEDASRLIRDNDAKKAAFSKDLSVLQRTLTDLRGGSLASTVVELTLTANRAMRTTIRLYYFQEDATWAPRYESRLDSNSGKLQLAQQAVIAQETDEDWGNVQMILSTSEPGGELMAPELESEFLALYDPAPRQQAKRRRTAGAPSADSFMMEEVVVTGVRRVDVGNFAVSYDIPGRISVANNADNAVTVDLARFDFDTELVTQIVPRESTKAFLAARFTYDKSVPLYGSDMAVYVDGVYAGSTMMPTALPQSEILLPMGQDRRIDVKSVSQGDATGKDGIVRKQRTETTDYVFEITNRRDSASYVEVMDRYPVARDDDIEVDVPRSATQADAQDIDDQPGLLMWRKTLDPGETWRIRHQYTIRYPAKSILARQ